MLTMENTSTLETTRLSPYNVTTPMEDIEIEKPLYSYGERIFIATCWLFISIFGSIGNSMVMVAVLFSKKLRTVTNAFVVNLAVADLLTCLFLIWSVFALLGPDGWPLPNAEWLCVAGGFVLFVCVASSLYSLAAISLNRLALITFSFVKYQKLYSNFNVAIIVAITRLIPLLVCTSLLLAGVGGFGYDSLHFTCSDLDQHPKQEEFDLAQSIVSFPIPLLIIVSSYTLLFRYIKRHIERQRNQPSTEMTATPSDDVAMENESAPIRSLTSDVESSRVTKNKQSSRIDRINQMEVEITKNLFLVVCAFLLLFSPYFIALFIRNNEHFLSYGGVFVVASSCINPVIYARRHPHFKCVFRCMIRYQYRDIPEPSDLLKKILRKL